MIKSILVTVIVVMTLHTGVSAQDRLYVILLKGEAKIAATPDNHPLAIANESKVSIPQKAVVSLSAGAHAIVYNAEKRIEIGGAKAISLTTDSMRTLLRNEKSSSVTTRFLEYLGKIYSDRKTRDESAGKSLGGLAMAIPNRSFTYSPKDKTSILSDTVTLTWDLHGYYSLVKNLLVVNTSRGDTVYNARPAVSAVTLYNLKEGKYHWSSRVKPEHGKIQKVDIVFHVPSESKRNELKKELKQFKEMISSFPDETRNKFLDEYLKESKIFTDKR